jgi:hypothetical protein
MIYAMGRRSVPSKHSYVESLTPIDDIWKYGVWEEVDMGK